MQTWTKLLLICLLCVFFVVTLLSCYNATVCRKFKAQCVFPSPKWKTHLHPIRPPPPKDMEAPIVDCAQYLTLFLGMRCSKQNRRGLEKDDGNAPVKWTSYVGVRL